MPEVARRPSHGAAAPKSRASPSVTVCIASDRLACGAARSAPSRQAPPASRAADPRSRRTRRERFGVAETEVDALPGKRMDAVRSVADAAPRGARSSPAASALRAETRALRVIDSKRAERAAAPAFATRAASASGGERESSCARRSGADHTDRHPAPGQRRATRGRRRRRGTIESAAAMRTLAGEVRDDRRLPVRLRTARDGSARVAHPRAQRRRRRRRDARTAWCRRRRRARRRRTTTSTPRTPQARESPRRLSCRSGTSAPRESRSSTIHASARSPSSYAEKLSARAGIARRRASTRSARCARRGSDCQAPSDRRNAALPGLIA